jgi:uncharacterized repeat protein (TIGR01451 family)
VKERVKRKWTTLVLAAILSLVMMFTAFPPATVLASTGGLVNGSFESDYYGWNLSEDSYFRSGTWGIAHDGQTINLDEYTWDFCSGTMIRQRSTGLPTTYSATDGDYLAYRLQNGPGNHRLYQDITLSPSATTLRWDMWYNNHEGTFDPNNQYLAVYIRDTSDNILKTLFITTEGVDLPSIAMTRFSADISAYAGQTVRLDIVVSGQRYYFDAAFDNFSISSSSPNIYKISPQTVYRELNPGQSAEVTKKISSLPEELSLNLYLFEYYSCPYLFTWDGAGYQEENDLYSVARGKNNEFTDYLYLQNPVAPRDGAYTFEVREIPGERSHTDRLKLITIDHPASVEVGVDSSGNVHSYRNASQPDLAADGEGENVLSLIRDRDALSVDMYNGDTVVADFSTVDITAGAKLILRVDGFEGPAGGQPTGEVPAILIQTRINGQWVTCEEFVPKELAAEGIFDLKPYLTGSRTVRLLSVSCLPEKYHRLDYLALDNTEDELNCTFLEPAAAVSSGFGDVLDKVRASDDDYAVLENNNLITVTFPFTPLTDEERDFVLLSEGYYEIVGQTFYVSTWNGSAWMERAEIDFPEYASSTEKRIDMRPYFPDPDGEYKFKIENKISGYWEWLEAGVDYAFLRVKDQMYYPTSAVDRNSTNILPEIRYLDEYEWNALNNWAIVKFTVPDIPDNDETADIWWGVTEMDSGLTVGLAPPVREDVPLGTEADFTETLSAANNSGLLGQILGAEVTFYSGTYPGTGTEIGQEQIYVYVGDNGPPTASNKTAETEEDTPISIDALAGASDPENDLLHVSGADTTGTAGDVYFTATRLFYNPTESLAYLKEGETFNDTFSYTLSDVYGHPATALAAVTVHGLNDAPVAVEDIALTDESTPVTIDVLANDTDPEGDTLSVEDIGYSVNGTAVLNPDNTITFTPNSNFRGYGYFYYAVTDENGLTGETIVRVYAPYIYAIKSAVQSHDPDGDGVPGPGDTLRYTVRISNAGRADATGVIFADTPDANTTLVAGSVTTTQGSVTRGNQSGNKAVEVSLGTIAPRDFATVTFEVTINPPPYGDYRLYNQGTITGGNIVNHVTDNPDTVQANDPTVTYLKVRVPGVSVWGLIGLAVLLAGAMVWVGRRRLGKGLILPMSNPPEADQ